MGADAEPWRFPEPSRADPRRLAAEREALEEWVDFHRATLLMKCAGLSSEELKRRPLAPSRLSLLGLVRHMSDVERWWFRSHAAGEDLPFIFWREGESDADFEDLADADAAANLSAYEQECDAARRAVKDRDLDEVVPSRGHHPERTRNVRWIFLHMLEEYARHNGHADLLREAIDGATGD